MRRKLRVPIRRSHVNDGARQVFSLIRCGDKKTGAVIFVRDYNTSWSSSDESESNMLNKSKSRSKQCVELKFKRSTRLAKGIRLSIRRRLLVDPSADEGDVNRDLMSRCDVVCVQSEQAALNKLLKMLNGSSASREATLIMYESTPMRAKILIDERELCPISAKMKIPVHFFADQSSQYRILWSAEDILDKIRKAEVVGYFMIDQYTDYKLGLREKGEKMGIYVEVKWSNGETTWEPAKQLYSDDPVGIVTFLGLKGFDVEKVKYVLGDGPKQRGRPPSLTNLMKKKLECPHNSKKQEKSPKRKDALCSKPSAKRILCKGALTSVSKRPRGRPPKQLKLQSDDECKSNSKYLKSDNKVVPNNMKKRPHGCTRERKNAQSYGLLSKQTCVEIAPLQQKRPRGRPRKHIKRVPLNKGSVEIATLQQKRPRGRPRKHTKWVPLQKGSAEIAPLQQKRPRGRPRKHTKWAPLSPLLKQNEDERVASVKRNHHSEQIEPQNTTALNESASQEILHRCKESSEITATFEGITRYDKVWLQYYNKLKEFHSKHGHCLPQDEKKDSKLYAWVAKQRSLRKLSKLKKERVQMLDTLGFSWKFIPRNEQNEKLKVKHNSPTKSHLKPIDLVNQDAVPNESFSPDETPKRFVKNISEAYSETPLAFRIITFDCARDQRRQYIHAKNEKKEMVEDYRIISPIDAITSEVKY